MPKRDHDDEYQERLNGLFHFVVDSAEVDEIDASELDEDLGIDDDLDLDTAAEVGTPSIVSERSDTEADVSASLEPGAPLLLLHRGHQHSRVLPLVLSDLARNQTDKLHLGVVAPMPRMSPDGVRKFFESATFAEVKIADPEAFARPDSFGATLMEQRDGKPYVGASKQDYWRYFTEPQPSGGTRSWVEAVLEAQRDVGANILLTPGSWSDPTEATKSLDIIRQHSAWAKENTSPGEHVAVNMTLPSSWLTTRQLRDRLLNEIVDMDEPLFYIRVRWPLLSQTYGQLLSAEILDGYVEIANVFEENDKLLLLPNSGLTGWVALAWGSHGFSTGIGSGERAFADTRVVRMSQNPRPAPTYRIFAEAILHVIDATTAKRLRALPQALACDCKFCGDLEALPAGQWSKALAGAHYLRKVGDLTAAIATGKRGRRVVARRLVRDAAHFVEQAQATVPLSGKNDPKHLKLWAERLR